MSQITIGRNAQNTIVVSQSYNTVSGNHATISLQNGQMELQDHSTNGTYVNGVRYHNQSVVIRQGDNITLGRQYTLPWNDVMRLFSVSGATQLYPQPPATSLETPQAPQAPEPAPAPQQENKQPQCLNKYNWMYSFLCFAAGVVVWMVMASALQNPYHPDDVLWSYLALFAGIVAAVICGRSGNKWAWSHSSLSAESFDKLQNTLNFIGAILSAIAMIVFLVLVAYIGGIVGGAVSSL